MRVFVGLGVAVLASANESAQELTTVEVVDPLGFAVPKQENASHASSESSSSGSSSGSSSSDDIIAVEGGVRIVPTREEHGVTIVPTRTTDSEGRDVVEYHVVVHELHEVEVVSFFMARTATGTEVRARIAAEICATKTQVHKVCLPPSRYSISDQAGHMMSKEALTHEIMQQVGPATLVGERVDLAAFVDASFVATTDEGAVAGSMQLAMGATALSGPAGAPKRDARPAPADGLAVEVEVTVLEEQDVASALKLGPGDVASALELGATGLVEVRASGQPKTLRAVAPAPLGRTFRHSDLPDLSGE